MCSVWKDERKSDIFTAQRRKQEIQERRHIPVAKFIYKIQQKNKVQLVRSRRRNHCTSVLCRPASFIQPTTPCIMLVRKAGAAKQLKANVRLSQHFGESGSVAPAKSFSSQATMI